MNNQISGLSKNMPTRTRNAYLVIWAYLLAGFLVGVFFMVQAIQSPSWQLWTAAVSAAGTGMMAAAALFLALRGRVELGVWLTIGASYAGVLGIVFALSGMGALFLVSSAFLSSMVAIQTLQSRQGAMITVGIAMGVVFLLLDSFLTTDRLSTSGFQYIIYFILPVMLAVFGYFIFRQFRDYSLRTKLIIAIIPATVLSTVVFSIISNNLTASQLNAQVGHNLGALADGSARTVADNLDSDISAVTVLALSKYLQESVAQANLAGTSDIEQIENIDKSWSQLPDSDPLVQEVIADELSVELRELQSAFPQFVEVFVTDQYGVVLTSTNRPSDYYQADETWWQKAWNGGQGSLYISNPVFDESAKAYALNLAVPITEHDRPDELVGVLRAVVDVNSIITLIEAAHFGETGRSEILLQGGQVLMAGETGLGTLDAETVAVIEALTETYTQADYEGSPSLVSKKAISAPLSPYQETISELGWTVVVHQDIVEAQLPVSTARNANMLIAIVIVLVMALAATGMAQIISRPLVRLTATARQVASGDIAAQATVASNDEIGALAATFNTMTARLRNLIDTLEQRVADRTKNLELAAEVGRSVSQVRALDVMLKDACELVREQFDLYYVQVYLADPSLTSLVLEAGTGTVGAELLSRGHRLPLNTNSINGRAAIEKRSVVISDTTASASFRPNPLLPDTRGEMAVPLIVSNRVVGVLDMQDRNPGKLTNEVLPAFEALAGQLAVAIQNASLVAEAEQARAEVEAQARRLVRESWDEYLDAIHKPEQIGFIFDRKNVSPLTEAGSSPTQADDRSVSAPIAVSGEPLGSLVVEVEDESRREATGELVQIVARQVAQQIESLRLLESAERYRREAEESSRRLTREGWEAYLTSKTGQSLGYFYDTREIKPALSDLVEAEAASVSLPIKIRDEKVGKLAVIGVEPTDQESMEIAAAVAERLSQHIESLRLLEETQLGQIELDRRARQLAAVSEISTVSSRELDIQKMLATVVHMTQRQFGLYHAHVFTFNEISQNLEIVACGWEEGDEHEGTHGTTTIPLVQEQSLVARAARSRQAVVVNDVRSDPGWLPNPLLPRTASEAAVPLVIGDQVLGVLDVQSDRVNAFSDEDVSIQATLAAQVATALQNARSFARAQRQAEREALLNAISQKIQSATSVEAVLQIAARELGHALGAPRTIAQLSMRDTN
jgi:GAF domain-containing protein/HAMP domain-containing protein